MDDLIVCKFGGSSITCKNDVQRIKEIVGDDSKRRIIVVSAPGKRNSDDIKVTDSLIKLAKSADETLVEKLIERYTALEPGNIEEIKRILFERLQARDKKVFNERSYEDYLKAFGEEACARSLANISGYTYMDPKEIFMVTPDFGSSKILPESKGLIRKNLKRRLDDTNDIFVVPGFYGFTEDGKIATFKRGGSDLTGAYITAVLKAREYENFTDKKGVFNAHPNLVKDAEKINELTFLEMRNLSYSGFGIIQADALEPVFLTKIPVHVRSTFNYPEKGTYIVSDRISNQNKPIIGIASKEGYCCFKVHKFGLDDLSGVYYKILKVFADEGISIANAPSGTDNIAVALTQEQLDSQKIGRLESRISDIVGEQTNIKFLDNLSYLVIAGEGLKKRIDIFAEVRKLFSDNGIDLIFPPQGEEGDHIIYCIDSRDEERAVNIIYNKYLR